MARNISGTKAERFLRWLKTHPEGKTFTECQRYVVVHIRKQDWMEREQNWIPDQYVGRIFVGYGRLKHRGAWSDHLSGVFGKPGLLKKFCEARRGKDGKVRYTVVKPIRAPFYNWSKEEQMHQHMKSHHADGSGCNKYPFFPQLTPQ